MLRSAYRAARWGLPALVLCLVSATGHAAPTVWLRVRPLRAAGGEGGVERDLPTRLTTALTRFLHDHAEPTLHVERTDHFEPSAVRDTTARYALEGDLSYASGAGEESGRYLLVARLIRQGRPDSLIGQWAGSASSLRYLTANLRNDPRVHTLGLVGEIGSRVLTAVAADAASPDQQWRALSPRLSPLRATRVTIIQANAPYAPRPEIAGGDTFRLRLPIGKGARSYLLIAGNGGRLEVVPLTLTAREDAPPNELQADSQTLHLPEGTREACLLCRSDMPRQSARSRTSGSRCSRELDEDDAPVHVLSGVNKSVTAQKEALLEEIAQNCRAWCVVRLRVTNRK